MTNKLGSCLTCILVIIIIGASVGAGYFSYSNNRGAQEQQHSIITHHYTNITVDLLDFGNNAITFNITNLGYNIGNFTVYCRFSNNLAHGFSPMYAQFFVVDGGIKSGETVTHTWQVYPQPGTTALDGVGSYSDMTNELRTTFQYCCYLQMGDNPTTTISPDDSTNPGTYPLLNGVGPILLTDSRWLFQNVPID